MGCPWEKIAECQNLQTFSQLRFPACFTQTGRRVPLSEGATSPGHNVTMPLHHHGSKHFIVGGGKAKGLRAGKKNAQNAVKSRRGKKKQKLPC